MKNTSFLLLTIVFLCIIGCNSQPAYKNTNLSAEERAEAEGWIDAAELERELGVLD